MLLHCWDRYRVCVIYQLEVVVAHQGKSCEAEERMENIRLVSWSIGDATSVSVLTLQDELFELLEVDPGLPIDHIARGHDPPTIAHVWQLLRPSVEPTLQSLPT